MEATRTVGLFIAIAVVTTACGPSTSESSSQGVSQATGSAASPALSVAPPIAEASASPEGTMSPPPSGVWLPAAPMLRERHGFDAVVLGDGTVLAVGDDWSCQPGGAIEGGETAESYDPTTDIWVEVGSLNKPRKSPATVILPDGSAMVIGGVNSDDFGFSSTKIFGLRSRAWTDGALLGIARPAPLGVSLDDGRILVVSSGGGTVPRTTSEIYDPRASKWADISPFPPNTYIDHLAALSAGRALAVGFDMTDSEPQPVAYRFDPPSGRWEKVEAPGGYGFELVTTRDGTAFAIGGLDGGELLGGTGAVVGTARRFDAEAGRWRTGTSMQEARAAAQVVALADGRILVAGGTSDDPNESNGKALATTEIYDPESDRWTAAGDLATPRMHGSAVRLDDGSVLVLGGGNTFNVYGDTPFCPPQLTSVERFSPGS